MLGRIKSYDKILNMYTVYKHVNKTNGKVYVGITKQIPKRRWMNGLGYQTQEVFYSAIKKYGWDGFTHEIIQDGIASQEEANRLEQYWISFYHSYIRDPDCNGYNMTLGGDTNQTEKLWKKEEDDIIKQYYPLEGRNVIKRLKNRTISSILNRAFNIGVFYISDIWTEEEINRLRECYPVEGIKCYSKFPGRTKSAIHRKATLLNLEHSIRVDWSEKEIRIVEQYYPNYGLKMLWRLENKSKNQLIDFVYRNKISFNSNEWTNEELETLKRYYPIMGCDCKNILDRSEMAIMQKASQLKIKSKNICKILNVDTNEVFESLEQASDEYQISKSAIKSCCCGKSKTGGGYKWRYLGSSKRTLDWTKEEDEILIKYYPEEGTGCFSRISNKTITACKCRVMILELSTIKEVICIETGTIYPSLKVAEEKTGINKSNIASACNGVTKTAGGYHWSYSNDEKRIKSLSDYKGKKRNLFKKRVYCIELDRKFDSASEAERILSINSVSECCKGHRKTAGGYHWKFVD